MNIQLICKLYDTDAIFFIDPILSARNVDKIFPYRDKPLVNRENLAYINQ